MNIVLLYKAMEDIRKIIKSWDSMRVLEHDGMAPADVFDILRIVDESLEENKCEHKWTVGTPVDIYNESMIETVCEICKKDIIVPFTSDRKVEHVELKDVYKMMEKTRGINVSKEPSREID